MGVASDNGVEELLLGGLPLQAGVEDGIKEWYDHIAD